MSGNEASKTERDGLEVVRAVVDVADYKRLEPSGAPREKTGDWRVWKADGRVADVEVTTFTDGEARSLFAALSERGKGREWRDRRLSCRWTVFVSDHSPRASKRNSMRDLVAALCKTLAFVEALGGTPEEMVWEADRYLISPETYFKHRRGWRSLAEAQRRGVSFEDWYASTDFWYPQLLVDHYKRGRKTQEVTVIGEPEPLGAGKGMVKTIPSLVDGGAGYDALASAIQTAIVDKTKKRQLDNAPDLKWLAVKLDGIPGYQLEDAFGPNSRPPNPTLEGISFDYFDEVWAFAIEAENFVVLRLFNGGTRQQHHVVSRSETAVSC